MTKVLIHSIKSVCQIRQVCDIGPTMFCPSTPTDADEELHAPTDSISLSLLPSSPTRNIHQRACLKDPERPHRCPTRPRLAREKAQCLDRPLRAMLARQWSPREKHTSDHSDLSLQGEGLE